MTLANTLFYYDGPLVITALHEEQIYIGVGIKPTDKERFLLVAIEPSRLYQYLLNKICLRTLITEKSLHWYLGSLKRQ